LVPVLPTGSFQKLPDQIATILPPDEVLQFTARELLVSLRSLVKLALAVDAAILGLLGSSGRSGVIGKVV
jgi:hypothetical protein